MTEIKVLPPHVADLIAAGEVVERPASVAKELMENAIDAGATKITVEISHGGLTFLRVTDNGSGIAPHALQTAFLRHATSKLAAPQDLEAIYTLGFRGEALAAICAVSRVQAISATADDTLGAQIMIEGGTPSPVEEAGCPKGTTIIVRDLFFNTPARLKFMKRDAAEGAAVFASVQHLALSHPEIAFQFIRDGKNELQTNGDGTLSSCIYSVLGREFALGFVPVSSVAENISVTGMTCRPVCCRGSRTYQHFFVNGRYIKSRLLMAALEEAYKHSKMVGKFPACVLHLSLKHGMVDVNVHPAKTEVKFQAEREVFSAVYHAVLSAIGAGAPQLGKEVPPPTAHDSVTAQQISLSGGDAPARLQVGAFSPQHKISSTPEASPALPAKPISPIDIFPTQEEVVQMTAAPTAQVQQTPTPARKTEETEKAIPAVSLSSQSFLARDNVSSIPPETPQKETKPETNSPHSKDDHADASHTTAQTDNVPEFHTPAWRIVGEVLHTYIIVEQGECIFFIDKHAAHERMIFNRMKAQDYTPMMQTLLVPQSVTLSAPHLDVLSNHLPLLLELGFEAEPFPRHMLIRQVPFHLSGEEIGNTLSEIADTLLLTGSIDPTAARDEILHTMSCKAAIKGGWTSAEAELVPICRAVMEKSVQYCPHGRPVCIEMTKYELEKKFGRA